MAKIEVIVEGSGKHCHLTRETLDIVYGKGFEMEVKKWLSQPGQFATPHKVTIVGPKGQTTMSILGPCRKADQVELSFTDARGLGLDCPIRESGDLAGSSGPAERSTSRKAASSLRGTSTSPPKTLRSSASRTSRSSRSKSAASALSYSTRSSPV